MTSATVESTLVAAHTIFVSHSFRNTTAVYCPHDKGNEIVGMAEVPPSTNNIDLSP